MFRFANPEYLNLLYIMPFFIGLFIYFYIIQNKKLNSFATQNLHRVLFPFFSKNKILLKFVLFLLSLSLIIIGLANPQMGTKIEDVKQEGIDVFIILDVSLSMTAEDIKPSRLSKAKLEISKLINRLKGDRIGLIVFSGDAYIQFPLTSDYSAANLFLNAVSTNSVPQPGTAIAKALELALKSFKGDDETKKAIIVITDGEDHEGNLDAQINEAVEIGISIFTIGMGSPDGVPIPVYSSSGIQVGYKTDSQGNTVLTKLDENTLEEIASKGNGKYYRSSNNNDELELIYNDLSDIEKTEYGTMKITNFEDRYYWFLLPALLLLIIEFLISDRKILLLERFNKKVHDHE